VERWMLDGRVFKFDRGATAIGRDNQVQITRPGGDGNMPELEQVWPEPAAGEATVQMWRTIPLRTGITKGPLLRGEFTIMAGVAKAVAQATNLITIWDQYFWSAPLARLLAARLNQVPTLRLLIVLPPSGTTHVSEELGLRRKALEILWKDLRPDARPRVKVFDLWNWGQNVGIYVHAKVQTYDDQLLVCGSANMNRRSFECDAELDCAVLHQPTVVAHLHALHACVMAQGGASPVPSWADHGNGWLEQYWNAMRVMRTDPGPGGALIEDPFFKEDPGNPRTPNGVAMPYGGPYVVMYPVYEPSSIRLDIGSVVMDNEVADVVAPMDRVCPQCPGDPGVARRLDELTFLLERCHEGDTWPWRTPMPRW
jgi:hypothetical protein